MAAAKEAGEGVAWHVVKDVAGRPLPDGDGEGGALPDEWEEFLYPDAAPSKHMRCSTTIAAVRLIVPVVAP